MKKEKNRLISQFEDRVFIDLIIENDDNKKNKMNLRIENQLLSKKDKFSSIKSSIENESSMKLNDINHHYNLLMNNE